MTLRRLLAEKIEDAMLRRAAPGDKRGPSGSARQRCGKPHPGPHSRRGQVPQEWHRAVFEKGVQKREHRAAKTNYNSTGIHLDSIDQCTAEGPSSGLKGQASAVASNETWRLRVGHPRELNVRVGCRLALTGY